ncbi:MAG: hypothetical protein QOF37_2728 [Thermoleophilaceae bacterium]|jgi:hypothetical protein|nr:hypothetical protein [Thermoleophilaceae bacterium]
MRALTAGIAAAALLAAPAAHASQDPNPPWPQLLPPFPVSAHNQPRPLPGCRKATVKCIDVQIRRMQRAQDRFGCDHRAVFATVYLTLTKAIRTAMLRDRHLFHDRRYLFRQVTVFAGYYFRMLHAVDRGRPIPEAWRIAIDTAASGDANAGQDMLLAINAHVQRDMPFVVAQMGLVMPDGTSRKPDHDMGNEILNQAYESVVQAIQQRYDPIVSLTNASWDPVDDVAGLEMVKGWREGVWRNAERLVNAKSAGERRQVIDQIETNAATWARMMATPQLPPGYRAQRDAYCHSKLGR